MSASPSITARVALDRLRDLHDRIRVAVTRDRSYATAPASDEGGSDFAFAPDLAAERIVDELCREWSDEVGPFRLVTEECERVYPDGAAEDEARFRLIIDPIDGTRVFLRDLRPAWTLSAIAPETPGRQPGLREAIVALQTEIPTTKQDIADTLYTTDESGPRIERWNVRTGERIDERSLAMDSSRDAAADSEIEHAFLVFCKFFPEGKTATSAIEEAVCRRLARDIGPRRSDRSYFFEDQYLSTGGQLHCLVTGAYAFVADLRPWLAGVHQGRSHDVGIFGHPYDIASLRMAIDAGVQVTDTRGSDLDPRMNKVDPVGFLAYANTRVRERVEPAVLSVLRHCESPGVRLPDGLDVHFPGDAGDD